MYDYTDGKLDWMAAGLPTEGTNATEPRAGTVARSDVPTCGIHERLSDVRERVLAAGWDASVVVNDQRVVLGLLRDDQLSGEGDENTVESVMLSGPSTFRPYVSIEEMAHYMLEHDLQSSPITTSDGRLVGLLTVGDAAHALHERHGHQASETAL